MAHNLDGVNMAAVVAETIKRAAERMGTSASQMRIYGWHAAEGDEAKELLSFQHSEVLHRPIDHFPPYTYWRVRRWTTAEVRKAQEQKRREQR